MGRMSHPSRKPSQDPYALQTKKLASQVQRLRGWVGSDPSREPELADALVRLTEHRLLGHGYAEAAADSHDAARMAGQLLTAGGPIGPYTSPAVAARYLTAVIHVAIIQFGMGLTDPARRTLESLAGLRAELRDHGLAEQLAPPTVIWLLSAQTRVALAADEVAAANSYADTAVARLAESGLRTDPDAAYLVIDVDRLAADARWAAGRAAEALGHLHAARVRYDALVDGRLAEPGRLSPALRERLAEPMSGLYGDLADRLVASGEIDVGIGVRRELIENLERLVPRLGESAQNQLAEAQTALDRDLAARSRTGQEIRPLVWTDLSPRTAEWLAAERPVAQRREQELKRQAELAAAEEAVERERAERAAAALRAREQAEAEAAARAEAERQAAAAEAERAEIKRRREERLEFHRLEVERREVERREAERREAERREAELGGRARPSDS
jgi:hypothetical protein